MKTTAFRFPIAIIASLGLSACTSDWLAPEPSPAPEIEIVKTIPLEWPTQCFDANFKYEDPDFQVHCAA